jgi:hypothetical protein
MGMNCTNCGTPNHAGARFCANCGAPLQTVVYQQAPQVPVSASGSPWGAVVIGMFVIGGIVVLGGIIIGGIFLFGSGMFTAGPAPTQQVIVVVPPTSEGVAQPQQLVADATVAPVAPAVPTNTVPPPATATLGAPMFTADKNSLCRKGPSTVYNVRTSVNKGDTVPILGKSGPNWEEWWLVEVMGSKCWVWSGLGQASGDLSGLQVVQAPPTPTATVANVKLTLNNNFLVPICYVYLRDVNNPGLGWSADILGAANVINPGQSFTWTGLASGTYDVTVSDCNSNSLDTKSKILFSGNTVVTFK